MRFFIVKLKFYFKMAERNYQFFDYSRNAAQQPYQSEAPQIPNYQHDGNFYANEQSRSEFYGTNQAPRIQRVDSGLQQNYREPAEDDLPSYH